MDANRFDHVVKLFSAHRLSRRAVMRQGSAGLVAAGLAAAGLSAAAAQDATPASSEERGEDDPSFLFVQSFQSGTLDAKDGSSDTFTLTLEHSLGQTLYFSDRPERIVGATPTDRFLGGLGFLRDNPPNAALVVETGAGNTDLAVASLNPISTESSQFASAWTS